MQRLIVVEVTRGDFSKDRLWFQQVKLDFNLGLLICKRLCVCFSKESSPGLSQLPLTPSAGGAKGQSIWPEPDGECKVCR